MIGNTIIELSSVDSTNNYAGMAFSKNDFEDGTIIWAHKQFAGRGQHDHSWNSEAGKNLTFTVCLKPGFLAPDRQFQLNKAIALSILDFLRSFPHPASHIPQPASRIPPPASLIKWPNDIYLGDQKIGGILIENKIMGSSFEACFAGIGININQTRFAPDIPNPVSLIHILRHEVVLKDALESLCCFLDSRYQELRQGEQDRMDNEYDQNLMGIDQWRTFIRQGDKMEGRIKGVDISGRLMIETANGKIIRFQHGEINLIT